MEQLLKLVLETMTEAIFGVPTRVCGNGRLKIVSVEVAATIITTTTMEAVV